MGPRQTADSTLSYSNGSCCKRSLGPVDAGWPTARTGFVEAEPPPSGFPAGRSGDQDGVGSHLVTTFSSPTLRFAQHLTYRLEGET